MIGEKCPHCGSKDIDCLWAGPEFSNDDETEVLNELECMECGAQFAIVYKPYKIVVRPFNQEEDQWLEEEMYEVELDD